MSAEPFLKATVPPPSDGSTVAVNVTASPGALGLGDEVTVVVVATWVTLLIAGVIAMASGSLPTVIGGPAVLVAVAIGVTVPEAKLAT